MSISISGRRGPLLSRFNSTIPQGLPLEWIVNSQEAEVYLIHDIGDQTDPEFLMATQEDILVRFAFTGDMLGIDKVSNGGKSIDAVVRMDPKNRFGLDRSALPIQGIVDDANYTDEQILESLVTYAYRKAESVKDKTLSGMARNFQVLTYDAILARFKLLNLIQSSSDIIPDQSTRTIFAKAGDGCVMKCNYCPEGTVPFVPYTRAQFIAQLELIKNAYAEIVGKEKMHIMNEGFINVSDIGWLDLFVKSKRTDLTSVGAAQLMRQYFPWLEKIGAFIGSSTALALSQDNFGNRHIDTQYYSTRYLESLRGNGELVNRLYLGLETAHTGGSFLLDKPINYQRKLAAAELIQSAGIKLKVIAQLGVLGEGFIPLDMEVSPENVVPWYVATDATSRWINQVQPYRVLESVHQESDNPRRKKLIEEGRIKPYTDKSQFEAERKRLRRGIRVNRNDFRSDPKYEEFLPADAALVNTIVFPVSYSASP